MDTFPAELDFVSADVYGGIVNSSARNSDTTNKVVTKVQCLPFYSVMAALGNPVIDYFSLDVEGAELSILQTIPWNKMKIRGNNP